MSDPWSDRVGGFWAAHGQVLSGWAEDLWVVFLFVCLLIGWFVILRELYQGASYLIGVLR